MPATPTSTYRLQFNPDFGFRDAIDLLPYLQKLGISHIYASPLLTPTPGSQHGYDVVDPTSLNPELGEESDFQELLAELASRGMGLILDIVPNHMAVSSKNEWWVDVLEHGQYSRYAHYFDIDWDRGFSRVVLPTLGDHFGTILENGELKLGIDERGLAVHYYENRFPIEPATYKQVLSDVRHVYRDQVGEEETPAEMELGELIEHSRELDAGYGYAVENDQIASGMGRRLWNLYRGGKSIQTAFDTVLEQFNGLPGDAESFDRLERLLSVQNYRLTYWRRASEEINYRRFFDIGDLISLRIEDPEVFEAVHALILEYAGTPGLDGFRADHVDGLFDPAHYAQRLHQRLTEAGGDPDGYLLLFEKILTGDEQLPSDWEISGTTGYEFAHRVNAVLADPDGFEQLEQHYSDITGIDFDFEDVVFTNKANVLDDLFSGQFETLVDGLVAISRAHRRTRDLSREQLQRSLRSIMVLLPVYRTYIDEQGVSQRDRLILEQTIDLARSSESGIEDAVWDFLTTVLTRPEECISWNAAITWIRRWQQFTGPLMAKGLEDTALYVYTPLASLNEVGGEPEVLDVDALHQHNLHVADQWSSTMLTSSTHDTKRSEDVRARIAVLSEFADEWTTRLSSWQELNASHRETIGGQIVPDANEEQLIYQTLLGAWPLDRAEFGTFADRIKEYMTKAMREAKVHTHWIAVNEAHEQAVLRFVERILEADPGGPFFRDLLAFQTRISSFGAWNSLSQVALKLTSPGFPDIYQGNELWDFSLADPDNRRTVDFETRERYVEQIATTSPDDVPELVQQWRDGRIKMLVTSRLLRDRYQLPEPFRSGSYLPLDVSGDKAENVIAFARQSGDSWAVTVAPRLSARLVGPDQAPVGEDVWGDTQLKLPAESASTWVDVITGEPLERGPDGAIRVADILRRAPVSVLRSN